MENTRKNQVLEILNYWKTIEFLGQTDIPEENPENKKIIARINKGETINSSKDKKSVNKIEIFSNLTSPNVRIEETLENDAAKYTEFPSVGQEASFCMGRTDRNSVVAYLEKFIPNREESPEIAYPKKSAIAWFSFRTDMEGLYVEESFQLSPILWAVSEWEKSRAGQSHNFSLDTREYDKIVEKLDGELSEKNVSEFLADLYEKVYTEFVKNVFPVTNPDSLGFLAYNRYLNEEKRDDDEDPADYADLGKSFFLNDIILLSELVEKNQFGDKNDYEKEVISYILAGYEKTKGMGTLARTIISPGESETVMRKFFSEKLNVARAPMGKWPAKFMPALMQQVAVNIAIDHAHPTPVFSVNGPPGTGKTTLLKEIVASNIVDRALLLAENGTDPDTLFEKHSFHKGPLEAYGHSYFQYAPNYYSVKNEKINDYGMLVASCNNAAVENITIDLPKGNDILESLEPSDSDDAAVKKGLEEVRDLFDIEKSEDVETIKQFGRSRKEPDIFFTRYANKLLDSTSCWGLVSAPFGKRSNIKKYCNAALKPFVEEYKANDTRALHKQQFAAQRKLFLKQYELVETLKKELEQLCTISETLPADLQALPEAELAKRISELEATKQKLSADIKAEQSEIMHLEETRPRGLFGRPKNTSTRDQLIAEHKETIAAIRNSIAEIEHNRMRLQSAQNYHALLRKYSDGDRKMTPIDAGFMEKYTSCDEKAATKAQVTNPWFTAQYNREREKLFLYACRLHKEFVASSKCMRHNIINLLIAWNMFDECGERMQDEDRKAAMPAMLQSIFLMTPVISTTFASAQSFLSDIEKSGVLGTLIVDESGQAQPQMSVGAMFRCRKSIIVGDPKQIEPVVTAETDMIKQLFTSRLLAGYKDKKISVQGFADYINPYGTFLGEDEEKEWVGCPLVVHRRCIDPMYTISNRLSYDGTMKQQTGAPNAKRSATFVLEKSCWIDVPGSENSGAKDHFVRAQGEVVLKLLEEKFRKDTAEIPRMFIITPFTSVKNGMLDMIRKSAFYKREPRVKKWLEDNNVGTVHTFQGQGTDEVIFLLGCDKNSTGAANWVNKNIVNVAATRVKFRFYLIGDKRVWMCKPVKMARECTEEMITAAELDALLPDSFSGKAEGPDGKTTADSSTNTYKATTENAADKNPLNVNVTATGSPKTTAANPAKATTPDAVDTNPVNAARAGRIDTANTSTAKTADAGSAKNTTAAPAKTADTNAAKNTAAAPAKAADAGTAKNTAAAPAKTATVGSAKAVNTNAAKSPTATPAKTVTVGSAKAAATQTPPATNAAAGISICPKCGKPLTEKNGKFGKFLGCSGFPKCRYTCNLPKSR